MSFYGNSERSHLERKMFFDDTGDLPRFETVKYPDIEELNNRALGLFWRPEEIAISTRDRVGFEEAGVAVKHIATRNLQRQIMLDGFQMKAPALVFGPLASLPEVESFITNWGFFEGIHSRSYTHIVRAIYTNPSEVFDGVKHIPLINKAAKSIAKYYDDLHYWNSLRALKDVDDHINKLYNEYAHKKAFWRAMFASFALEGIRFMVSFACNFGLAENQIMEGPAKVLKLIARDELEHLKFTVKMLNNLVKEDPDFKAIRAELKAEMYALFKLVVDEEKEWALYLFAEGSVLGLNAQKLCDFVDFRAFLMMASVGMRWKEGHPAKNNLTYMDDWLGYGKRQNALQETEGDQYLIGLVDLDDDDLSEIVVILSKPVD